MKEKKSKRMRAGQMPVPTHSQESKVLCVPAVARPQRIRRRGGIGQSSSLEALIQCAGLR